MILHSCDNLIATTPQKARGSRLRFLRSATKLSREEFSKKHGISAATLKNWENGRFGGLTEKGACHVLKAFAECGILANIEWLLYGKGEGPFFSFAHQIKSDGQKCQDEFQRIQAELHQEYALFAKHVKNAVQAIVEDDSMCPRFRHGDMVAGQRVSGHALEMLDAHDCIVQLNDGRMLIRRLKVTSTPSFYNLIHLNAHTRVEYASIYHTPLLSAAPIIWVRASQVSPYPQTK